MVRPISECKSKTLNSEVPGQSYIMKYFLKLNLLGTLFSINDEDQVRK